MEKVRQIELRTRRQVDEMLAGHYRSVFRGRGIDFDSVREYVAGDETRSIDWNVTARANRPFVKMFREERELCGLAPGRRLRLGRLRLRRHHQARAGGRAGLRAGALGGAQQRQGGAGHVQRPRSRSRCRPPRGARHVMRVVRDILNCQPARAGDRPRGGAGSGGARGAAALGGVSHLRLRAARRRRRRAGEALAGGPPGRRAARRGGPSSCAIRASASCPTWVWSRWRTRRPAR